MRILCVGGGTLGSVTPLLAVVEELRSQASNLEVEWWGTSSGPERSLVQLYGITFKDIPAGKFRRYLSFKNLADLFNIFSGVLVSLWRLGVDRFDCVLTAGSYVAVPVGWSAALFGVPVFVHQQDVRLGLANKLVASIATKISVTLPETGRFFPENKTVVTGNSVRQNFFMRLDVESAKKKLSLKSTKPVLVIIGGGTGAWALNKIGYELRQELTKICQVVNITGINKQEHSDLSQSDYITMPLTQDSSMVLSVADLVVTRAGMGVLSELSALRKAAIVVPMPNSHQEDNAKYFSDKEAIVYLSQVGLTPEKLLDNVRQLINNEARRLELGSKLAEVLPVNGASAIAQLVIKTVNNK